MHSPLSLSFPSLPPSISILVCIAPLSLKPEAANQEHAKLYKGNYANLKIPCEIHVVKSHHAVVGSKPRRFRAAFHKLFSIDVLLQTTFLL